MVAGIFLLFNLVAAFHVWRFTHFSPANVVRTVSPDRLSWPQKIKTMFTGVSLPKPVTCRVPIVSYEDVTLTDGTRGWWLPVAQAKSAVVLAHGYGGEKSSMLGRALIFRNLSYHTFLIDLSGASASESNTTTIGFKEASQITAAYTYAQQRSGSGKLFLFGSSMGAVAILKAVAQQGIQPTGILLECPFSTIYRTVCNRFRIAGIPEVPLAGLLTFWGGVLNGFNAFSHNPVEYAKAIHCPALLLRGAHDPLVTQDEIKVIYEALDGPKDVLICTETGYFDFMETGREDWTQEVIGFVDKNL